MHALTVEREINPEIPQQRSDLRIYAPPGEVSGRREACTLQPTTRSDELSPSDDAEASRESLEQRLSVISYNTYVARISGKGGFPAIRFELFGFRKICEAIIA